MTQVTVRRIDESWVAKAKAEAVAKGVSMNQILVDALGKGLGVSDEPVRKNNLDRFSGDSPEEFGEEWEESMKVFNQIDPELWK
jgi:hypothetical protein